MSMTRKEFDALCKAKPGATLGGPGELDAWKIGGKMFACWGDFPVRDENTKVVVVRVADTETAEMLIDTGAARKPPYFRGAWVELVLEQLDKDEAQHRIDTSYNTIRAGLTKKVQATLPEIEEA